MRETRSSVINIGSVNACSGDTLTETVLQNTLISANTSKPSGDFNVTGNIITNAPLLAPLDHYGGPTKAMAMLPGSPARNAATVLAPVQTTDQRGFPIVGILPDIGAYEAGTLSDFEAFAIEPPGAALAPTGDADQDGRSDLLEYAAQSDPRAPSSGEMPASSFIRNAQGAVTQASVAFQVRLNAADLLYTLQRSTTLGSWTTVATCNGATKTVTVNSPATANINGSGLVSVTDPGLNGLNGTFYRVEVQKVQ